MEPNSLIVRWLDLPMQILRTGGSGLTPAAEAHTAALRCLVLCCCCCTGPSACPVGLTVAAGVCWHALCAGSGAGAMKFLVLLLVLLFAVWLFRSRQSSRHKVHMKRHLKSSALLLCLAAGLHYDEVQAVRSEIATRGLRAQLQGKPVLSWAREVLGGGAERHFPTVLKLFRTKCLIPG